MNQLQSKSRIIEFDIIKCLAIFLVIWGHAIMHLSSEDHAFNSVYQLICSFHMPLFMLIAGFFSAKSLTLSFKDILGKKFMQLIYPAITFGALFYLADILIMGGNHVLGFNLISYFIFTFWFLKSCFLCYLITWLCLKISRRHKWIGALLVLAASMILPTFKLNWMLPFFVGGFLLSYYYNAFKKNVNWIFPISTILFVVTFIFTEEFRHIDLLDLKSEILKGNVNILNTYFNFQLYRLGIGAMGSLMIISGIFFFTKIFRIKRGLGIMSAYGRETLGIYILQTFILEYIMSYYIDLSGLNLYLFSFLITPLISIAVMIVCYQIIRITYKNKYLKKSFWGIQKTKISTNKND